MCVQASLTFTGNLIMSTRVAPMSARQVAGRLQVEVWHGTEISEADGASQPASQPSVTEEDQQERRLDCVVRIMSLAETNECSGHLGALAGQHWCRYSGY